MSRHRTNSEKGFVLEIGGQALLAFRAGNIDEARCLCTQDWFTQELVSYRSRGLPIWDGLAEVNVRRANASEAAELQIALTTELARKEYEGYVFAFFVPIDPGLH
jgi:hypothetical protein